MRGDATVNRLLNKYDEWLRKYEAWYGSRLDEKPSGEYKLISASAGPLSLERVKGRALVSHGWENVGTVQVTGVGYSHTYQKYVKFYSGPADPGRESTGQ